MFQEIGFQLALVLVQLAARWRDVDVAQGRQATLDEVMQIANHGTSAETGQAGDFDLAHALGFEPDHFHFLLHAGMGMVKALVLQGSPLIVREGELVTHNHRVSWGTSLQLTPAVV